MLELFQHFHMFVQDDHLVSVGDDGDSAESLVFVAEREDGAVLGLLYSDLAGLDGSLVGGVTGEVPEFELVALSRDCERIEPQVVDCGGGRLFSVGEVQAFVQPDELPLLVADQLEALDLAGPPADEQQVAAELHLVVLDLVRAHARQFLARHRPHADRRICLDACAHDELFGLADCQIALAPFVDVSGEFFDFAEVDSAFAALELVVGYGFVEGKGCEVEVGGDGEGSGGVVFEGGEVHFGCGCVELPLAQVVHAELVARSAEQDLRVFYCNRAQHAQVLLVLYAYRTVVLLSVHFLQLLSALRCLRLPRPLCFLLFLLAVGSCGLRFGCLGCFGRLGGVGV